MKCTGGCMSGYQCPHEATWRNQNGVEVCGHHKLLLNAFTWEGRNERKWEVIEKHNEAKIAYRAN